VMSAVWNDILTAPTSSISEFQLFLRRCHWRLSPKLSRGWKPERSTAKCRL
jgi:hypothetical protein